MKVRIGVSLGAAGAPAQFSAAVDALEAAGVDSLWLPEMVYGSLVDPFIGMTYALARTSRLKVGTGVAVLPGRHPVLVAKQLATLAGLSPRRVLPVFGLKPARPAKLAAFPVPPGRRAAVFDDTKALRIATTGMGRPCADADDQRAEARTTQQDPSMSLPHCCRATWPVGRVSCSGMADLADAGYMHA